MTGVAPRLLCARTLMRMVQTKSYGNLTLHTALAQSTLTPQDKRLCTALFQGTLERLLLLDAGIASLCRRPLHTLDLPVLCVLRCGICELLTLHTPESAVVNLWTETVKQLKRTSAASMVNAVLRGFLRNDRHIPLPTGDPLATWSVQYSVPEPLLRQLVTEYGKNAVQGLLESSTGEPPIYLRRNPLLAAEDAWNEAFDTQPPQPVPHLPMAYRWQRGTNPAETKPFADGWFHVQDLSSQLCCMALDAQPGETVLDVCAAPGGKTLTIATQMQGTGKVYAYDLHPNRVRLIADGAKRLQLHNVIAAVGDATAPAPDRPMADRVLCDVPCSGFGVMRRKPELRYKDLADLTGLPAVQTAILTASAAAVKPGGVLVYSTCTLSRAENDAVVQAFLETHPCFSLTAPWACADWNRDIAGPMTTLFPQMLGSDGFFLAKMRRATDVAGCGL